MPPRIPFARNYPDQRRTTNFLDSCAFDPKYFPEHEAAQQIRQLASEGKVILILAHSNQKEIDHPNTPEDVKRDATNMNYSIPTNLTAPELTRRSQIHAVLTGNGDPANYEADATHVFEAGKYFGYFITTDSRILEKRDALSNICAAIIMKPSEWLALYESSS